MSRKLPLVCHTMLVLLLFVVSGIRAFAQPAITSFSPASGPSGSSITISGSNFNPVAANNIVYFGAVRATVTGGSVNNLTATVPFGATYQPVSVLNTANGLTAYTAKPFDPTFTNPFGTGIPANFYQPKVDFTTGSGTQFTAISDLDGDGKPDMVVVNNLTNSVSVLRNITTFGVINATSFAPKVEFATGSDPQTLAVGDVDGDGRPDIVVANFGGNTVSVLRNTASAGSITASSFSATVDFATGTNPRGVSINDIDGDGRPELILGDYGSNAVSVLQNLSAPGSITTASFAPRVDYATGTSPTSVATSDVDGDGRPEILVSNGYSNVSVFLNTSTTGSINAASFSARTDFAVSNGYFINWIAAADMDSDGKNDLVTGNTYINDQTLSTVSIFRNTASAGSISQSSFASRVDFTVGKFFRFFSVGDADGDGKPDVIIPNQSDTLSILRNTSVSGSITSASFAAKVNFKIGSGSGCSAVGDLDADGKPEVVTANNASSTLSILKILPSMAPPVITSFSPSSGPLGTAVTISGSNFHAVTDSNIVYFGAVKAAVTAGSATSLTVTAPAGTTYKPLSVLNTSSHLTGFAASPFITTFLTSFGAAIPADFYKPKVDFATGALPYFVTIGDLDGDGKADLVTANANANTISIFRNTSITGSITASSFAAKVDLTTGDSPLSVAIGDIDGDGKADIIVANERSASLLVYRNLSVAGAISTASFASPVSFSTGEHPYSIALADLDGDGKTDITVANAGSNTISILRNTSAPGTSSFATKVDIATGLNPRFVATGDVDGDGKPDIAVVNQQSNTVSVLRNVSTSGTLDDASFSMKVDFMTGASPINVAIGDLDGDGKADLAIANFGDNSISVFRNTSTSGTIAVSSFAAKVDFATSAQPFSIALGDANGDGKVDIAIANSVSNGTSILRNTTTTGTLNTGSFAAAVQFATGDYPVAVALGDLDGDGIPELITSNAANTVSVLQSASIQRPVITSFSPASGPVGTTITINGTGFNAAATLNTVYFGPVKALVTSASANSLTVTVPAGATYQAITVLNTGNGLSGSSVKPFVLTFPNPSGSGIPADFYSPKVDITTGNTPTSLVYGHLIASGDIDGDGKPDLITASTLDNKISVYRNVSITGVINANSFANRIDLTSGGYPTSISIADMDGDGKLDIVAANLNTYTLSIYRNIASPGSITSASFAPILNISTASSNAPYALAIGDVDGDGKPDILYAHNRGPLINIDRNISTPGSLTLASFASPVQINANMPVQSITLSDLDGDSKPDLVIGVEGIQNVLSFLRNTATPGTITTASYSSAQVVTIGGTARDVSVGDLDGDGKPDLVISNKQTGGNIIAVMRNTSTTGTLNATSFAAKVDFAVNNHFNDVVISDVDGDGKPDLVVANSSSDVPGNTISVLRNTSTAGAISAASFAPKVDFTTGSFPGNLVVVDIDGDGIPDVATVNTASLNNTQLSTISLLKAGPAVPVFQVAPVVTAFNPASSPSGTAITITGSNFNTTATANTVFFGAVRATVTAGSATSLTVNAPAGATYQPISVLNQANGLTGYASSPFINTFTNPLGSGIPAYFYKPKVDFATQALPYTMAFADLDGDGKTDMAVVNANSTSVSILRNISTTGSITSSSFAPQVTFATGSEPRGIAVGDVDGDGKPDLVVTNSNSSSVSVLRNTATAGNITTSSFAAGVQFTVGDHPYSVAIGDLDNDGRPELVTANLFSATVSILKNTTATGVINASSFAAKTDFVAGGNPRFVALGDLDGDGKTDIAVANYQDATVSVFRNTFAGAIINASSFAAKVDFATGTSPQGVVIGDLDGDGKPDLSVVNSGSNSVSVLRNTAIVGIITPASFATKVDLATGSFPFALAIGDADGDGKADLLTANANSSTISILRNSSTSGSITASSFIKTDFATGGYPVYINIGDLNGNGTAEVATVNAVGNSVSLFEITPASVGAAPVINSVSPLSSPVNTPVMINGANFNPVAANNIVYFGAVKAAVTAASASSITVTAPAGASYQPLFVLNSDNGLSASSPLPFIPTFNNPFGSGVPANFYKPKVDFTAGYLPYGITLGDIDGDGKADMVIANTFIGTISVRRNTSATGSVDASTFAPPVNFSCNNPFSVVLSDMDGDGRLDIVAQNLSGSAVSIFRNSSTTGSITASSFAPAVDFNATPNSSSYAIAAGDLDGDGKPDIATVNSNSSTLSVLRNLSVAGSITASSFAPAVNFTTGAFPRSVAISDIDGDGKSDISVANANDNTISVFRNTAVTGTLTTASFAARVNFATGTQPTGISTGDLDGDGKADIAVLNHGSNTISVLRNSSTSGSITASSLAAKVDFATGSQPYAATIADVDGDGKPDLLAANSGSNTISVLRNSAGTGTITAASFAGKVDFTTGGYLLSITAGDINNDGIPEVISGSSYNNGSTYLVSVLAINAPAPFTGQTTVNAGLSAQAVAESGISLQVYPNPSTGAFTVQLSGMNVTAGNLEILNESGKTIERRSLNLSGKASFTQRLSVANLPAGIYYVKIITTRGVQIAKVVVQR